MTQSTPDPTPTVTEHDFTVRENRPGKVLAVHLNYPSRIAQRGRSPQAPGYFLKAGTSLARTGDTIERPAGTELLAYLLIAYGAVLSHLHGYGTQAALQERRL